MNEGLVGELGLQLGGGGGASDTGEQGKVPVYQLPAVQYTMPVYRQYSKLCQYTSAAV